MVANGAGVYSCASPRYSAWRRVIFIFVSFFSELRVSLLSYSFHSSLLLRIVVPLISSPPKMGVVVSGVHHYGKKKLNNASASVTLLSTVSLFGSVNAYPSKGKSTAIGSDAPNKDSSFIDISLRAM